MVKHKKLAQPTLIELDQFLKRHDALSLIELQGFLTAIISGPHYISFSEWMDACGISDIDFDSEEQAQLIMGRIMAFYNTIAKQLANGTFQPLHRFIESGLVQTPITMQTATLWAQGYLMGAHLDQDTWFKETMEDKQSDLLANLLFPIMALVLKDEVLKEEMHAIELDKDPQELREISIRLLPQLANAIYEYWLVWRQEAVEPSNTSLPAFKIGRNDLCPCNSGKKYKKCCLH